MKKYFMFIDYERIIQSFQQTLLTFQNFFILLDADFLYLIFLSQARNEKAGRISSGQN